MIIVFVTRFSYETCCLLKTSLEVRKPTHGCLFKMGVIQIQEEATQDVTTTCLIGGFLHMLVYWALTVCQVYTGHQGCRSKPNTDSAIRDCLETHRQGSEPAATANLAMLLLNIDQTHGRFYFLGCHLWRQSLWGWSSWKVTAGCSWGFTELEVPNWSMALLKGVTSWFFIFLRVFLEELDD